VIELYGQFGYHLGIVIQICDDLTGTWSPGGRRSDLAAGKRTLRWPMRYPSHLPKRKTNSCAVSNLPLTTQMRKPLRAN